ncbi:hypothetical protein HWV62_32230 [Athelia sp. TMB]|nr:hypothetical protein HWV62_32230 [Athelia sp. TMB]
MEAMESDHYSEKVPLSAAISAPSAEPQLSTSNDCPDFAKFASSSQPVASSSNPNPPLRRESTEIIPPDPPKEKQVTAAELAKLGIKVRDFAYESVLPPIPPYIRGHRAPTQVIVGPAPAPRTRRTEDDDDDNSLHAGPSHRKPLSSNKPASQTKGKGKARSLERESTEPEDNQVLPPTRERGYADLTEYHSASQSQPRRHHAPQTPPAFAPLHTNSQSQSTWAPEYSSQSQSTPPFEYSQESNYIDTPLVTPNGSLQWLELDIGSAAPSQMDTDSQLPPAELISYSQLGFSPFESQMESQSQPPMPPLIHTNSSPLSAPPHSPLPSASPAPGVRQRPSLDRATSSPSPARASQPQSRSPRRRRVDDTPGSSPLSDPTPSPGPRYNFRKRRATSPEPQPTVRRATRSQSRQPQPPSARPPIFSRQSAQARGKSQQNSKTSKTIRKSRAPGRGRDENMIIG